MINIKLEQFKTDLNKLFEKLNYSKNIFITCDLNKFGKFNLKKKDKVESLYLSLKSNVSKDSTIFVPTPTLNLCNTNIPFDLHNTKSHNASALAEYIRTKKDSIRSMHPFWSVSGIGENAKILKNISKHAYGMGSIWGKFLDIDTTQINFCKHPSKAVTLIHHIETIVGVPYRYTKEFNHPILLNNKIKLENYYLSVIYKNSDILKKIKLNEHFFDELEKKDKLKYFKSDLGFEVWSFRMRDFYNIALNFFNQNIYTYLEFEPNQKPFRK